MMFSLEQQKPHDSAIPGLHRFKTGISKEMELKYLRIFLFPNTHLESYLLEKSGLLSFKQAP